MDRNRTPHHRNTKPIPSLSARRAWIEIVITAMTSQISVVALRKESVDRNQVAVHFVTLSAVALRKESVDRNTNFNPASLFDLPVALRKESVDRNNAVKLWVCCSVSRSPQGERG